MSEAFDADDLAVIESAALFQGIGGHDLELALSAATVSRFAAGEQIVAEGQALDGMYVILSGTVEFFLPERTPSGESRQTRVRLNQLGPRACFGEYSFLDEKVSSASAQALSPARIACLHRDHLRRLLSENDSLGKRVYENLAHILVGRLRRKDAELDELMVR